MRKDWKLAAISARGADAASFLQGQLTCDVSAIDGSGLGAWCNPKGRVIALFHICRLDDGFLLILPADLADDVLRRLTMYRLRSKVDLAIEAAGPETLGLPADSGFDDWQKAELERGIAWIDASQSELYTPHMLNLDLLGAVSFDKGCYTGQEVVARTHYRGKSKRRLRRFRSPAPVQAGDKLRHGERDAGSVVSVVGEELLAVVPVADSGFCIGDTDLEALPLPGIHDEANIGPDGQRDIDR